MEDLIIVRRDGDIATVVFNRPDKRNALNQDCLRRFTDAMEELSADTSLRCVVLRGAGDKAFVSGADISGFESERSTPELARTHSDTTHKALAALQDSLHPTVAMIHGWCMGGGLELALACDIRIAGRSGRFGVPVKRMGLYLSYPLIDSLLSTLGRPTTLELLLEGAVFDAEEALEKGVITHLVEDAELEQETYAAAQRIADGAPLSARHHRRAVRRMADQTPLSEEEITASYGYADTDDYHAAYRAFMAKDKARFKGS